MSKQNHRTCIRMSEEEYGLLKKKSKAAGRSANAWLMDQLESNRPSQYRKAETREAIALMNEVGKEINAIAREFNSGYGTAEQLDYACRRLCEVYEHLYALRKLGYPNAA